MPLRVLTLEPYYGGSHRAFLDGYRRASRHSLNLLTMPARKWKWRMRGAALTMGRRIQGMDEDFDIVFASDYVDLAALKALVGPRLQGVPLVAYFHENQITYPVQEGQEVDYQYGFTNMTTCLTADRVLFNSRYHLESFLEGAEGILGKMPDCVPRWVPGKIRDRAQVVPVGVDLETVDHRRPDVPVRTGPLTILWNHRWEFDKGPDEFFEVVMRLAEEREDFRLAVVGESFERVPEVFEEARTRLADRAEVFGYVPSREAYCDVLLSSDVVVSTALHEFFGVSVVEAIYAGCAPLLPDRLSYPEILPDRWHKTCLYHDTEDLADALRRWIRNPAQAREIDPSRDMRRFGWSEVAPRLDHALEEVSGRLAGDRRGI